MIGSPAVFEDKGDTGETVRRIFCGKCGTPLESQSVFSSPAYAVLKTGTFDDPNEFVPDSEMYCSSAMPWWLHHGQRKRYQRLNIHQDEQSRIQRQEGESMINVQDIVDIQQLEAFCHHAVDHTDQSLFPQVFTEDAVFDARLCGGPVCEGLAAIMAFFALGKPPHPASHHMTNCWVREEQGRVLVKMKWMVPDRQTPRMWGGENNDHVVRTSDGWRIRERIAILLYPDDLVPGADRKVEP